MRNRHRQYLRIVASAALCAAAMLAQAAPDPTFTYQGQLKEGGEPYTGLTDMRFGLWNADDGGTQLDQRQYGVYVEDGLFTVGLDFGTTYFDGEPLWLEISLPDGFGGWIALSPRQPIRPAPYAIYAFDGAGSGGTCLWSQSGSDIYYMAGDVGFGTISPDYPVDAEGHGTTVGRFTNTSTGTSGNAIIADTSSTGGVGLLARNYATSGTSSASYGLSYSPTGNGVRGQNLAQTGDAVGVYGGTGSVDGIAVYGYATNTTGTGSTIGVKGRIGNSTGAALYGQATATTGTAHGLWAETAAPEGSGVFGQNTAASGDNVGVDGVAWSPNGKGVMGYNGATNGAAVGVLGRTNSSVGYGVRGEAPATSGVNYGVYGETASASGYGVYGEATGYGKGVAGACDDNYGYVGWSNGGVLGYSVDGYGVRGFSTNDWGVYGVVPNGSTQAGVVGAIINDTGGTLWVSESGVSGSCQSGKGVSGRTFTGVGVYGSQVESNNYGYLGTSTEGAYGQTANSGDYGVHGKATGSYSNTAGVYGEATGATYGIGVRGSANNTSGAGVYGYNGGSGSAGDFYSVTGTAGRFQNHQGDCVTINHNADYASTAALSIYSTGDEEPIGIELTMDADFGRLAYFDLNGSYGYIGAAMHVEAETSGRVAEFIGENTFSDAHTLVAQSDGYGSAVFGINTRGADDAPAVYGKHASSNYGVGVKGEGGYRGVEGRVAPDGDQYYYGVYGYVNGGSGYNRAIYGYASGGATNYAGYFSGNVHCTGTLSKGSGTFMIDHPLDPANKYLYHSFVESPDMMNVYNGNITLGEDGTAVVTLPDYFEALNRDFRYQLTCIGGFAQVYIAAEVRDNQFTIAGGTPGLKVSWQVTGVRQDPFAEANRVQVEVDKPEDERGTYLHPEARGLSNDLQVDNVREARQVEQRAAAAEAARVAEAAE